MHSLVDKAIGFAARAHEGDRRKSGDIPYIAHPVGVAMILQAMDCDETIIIAALLHDTVEDTEVTLDEIKRTFGNEVAKIVAACTEPAKKQVKWEDRKLHTIRTLRDASLDVKLVMAADKYHNLCHTRHTMQQIGSSVWQRFGRGKSKQAWYYRSVLESIVANVPDRHRYPLFDDLETLIDDIFDGVPATPPS